MDIDSTMLYRRSAELNYDITCTTKRIPRFNSLYDYDTVRNYLLSQREIINTLVSRYIEENDIDNAMVCLDDFLKKAHKAPGASLKKQKMIGNNIIMDRVNNSFHKYRNMLTLQSGNENELEGALNRYINDRKALLYEVVKKESDAWQRIIKNNDHKDLWAKIDWKGNYSSRKPTQHPSIEEFQSYFSDLYDCSNNKELENISGLHSDITIPVLDQPIDINEVNGCLKDMKNGGFDFNIPVLSILVNSFSVILLLILNFMLYIKYPLHLALSILCVIPKKGNLLLPKILEVYK